VSYVPPGLPASSFGSGTHQVVLAEFKPIDKPDTLAKLGAKIAFRATFKSIETAQEIDLLIKFNGSKADYYAGLNIDRLHLAAGLPEPVPGEALDITTLVTQLDGVPLLLEVNDKGYASTVLVPMQAASGESDRPF
jgi:hypothetical protein